MQEFQKVIENKTEVRLVAWPSPQDYNEAIQNPAFSFANSPLALTEPELNLIGLPKPSSGNFASVYRLFSDEGEWAVRCFLQPMSDQQERYAALSQRLAEVNFPQLVKFEFLPEGIRVHNHWFPILKMEWVNGESLLEYIRKHLAEPETLRNLAEQFKGMIIALRDAGIAHGDLQHGNIIVEPSGQLRLVDYDGCFVSSLAGKQSNELGHRNYQHPRRSADQYNEHMDTFSAYLIWVSILALAENPGLWDRLQAGDECLLFRRQDFLTPEYSRAFHLLEIQSESIRFHSRMLRSFLKQDPTQLPALDQTAEIPADLPPLQAVLEVSKETSSIKPRAIEDKAEQPGWQSQVKNFLLPPRRKGKSQYIRDFIPATAAVFIAFMMINVSNWAVANLSKTFMIYSWPPNQDERAKELKRINDMLEEAETGGPMTEEDRQNAEKAKALLKLGSGVGPEDNPNYARELFIRATQIAHSDPEKAESCYQGALNLSGKDGNITLGDAERAEALEFIGSRKSSYGRGDFGTEELDAASKLYERAGFDFRAAVARREYANAAYMSRQYTRAYQAYLECLTDKSTPKYHYSSLVSYGTQSAIEILTNQLPDYKSDVNLRQLWDSITRLDSPEHYSTLLSEITTKGTELLQRRKLDDARVLFEVQKDLASRRADQKHFEEIAIRKLESVDKLQGRKRNSEESPQRNPNLDNTYQEKVRLPRPGSSK